ncbi:peptidylprolyl isomerase [Falsiroseomonas selenitidurans]|uniref:Parvulin-like PPIase n=1 Tax=Falsiroseomonas selenitidurans TaxID=2716335 RepID=A0ABX1E9S8_9PROT|nr:peptidylprolyl isomerase [Falsiroseomonas selenitidurans]NKC33708.1 peptidylprolyl isomerase [Falsiroseomonas selenitidurans]
MRRPALWLALLMLPGGLALAQAPSPGADPVVARVDGAEIRLSEVQAEAQRLPEELRGMPAPTLFPLLLDQMITQKAITAAARASNLAQDPEVAARLRRAEEETLQQALITRAVAPAMTEEALRARYQQEVAGRTAEEEVRARHILVPTEAEARAALAEARRDGADFAEIARRRSTGPGSREGGDLGFFKRADMIPAFAEAAFAMQPGEISATPVRTQFGWHVIKVEARRAVPPPPFEEARESLRQRAFEEGVNAAVERIRAAARIERFNLDGSPQRAPAPSLLDGAAPPAAAPQPRR